MDGLSVVGTRATLTINTGVVGNSHPPVTTREFSDSPDLQVNLSVSREHSREGTQVVNVVDVSRSETDPAMFQLPAGYVVEDREPAQSEKCLPARCCPCLARGIQTLLCHHGHSS
jgi:hypothetical protein